MGNINISHSKLADNMLRVKVGTLMYHLPEKEVKRYHGCYFEFDVEGASLIPIALHTWVGKNQNYNEKYHKVFRVPDELKIPLKTPL